MLNDFDDRGKQVVGSTLAILYNGSAEQVSFVLPEVAKAEFWRPILDTSSWVPKPVRLPGGARLPMDARSIIVLRLCRVWPSVLAHWLLSAQQGQADTDSALKLHSAEPNRRIPA